MKSPNTTRALGCLLALGIIVSFWGGVGACAIKVLP